MTSIRSTGSTRSAKREICRIAVNLGFRPAKSLTSQDARYFIEDVAGNGEVDGTRLREVENLPGNSDEVQAGDKNVGIGSDAEHVNERGQKRTAEISASTSFGFRPRSLALRSPNCRLFVHSARLRRFSMASRTSSSGVTSSWVAASLTLSSSWPGSVIYSVAIPPFCSFKGNICADCGPPASTASTPSRPNLWAATASSCGFPPYE
jgi:hypothetical protein